jgi:hypothetical protein
MAVGPTGGVAFLKFNGLQYQLRGQLKVQPNMTEAEWIANQDRTITYTEKAVVPYIEGTLSDSGGLSVQQLSRIRGATVLAQLSNGKQYTLQQAGTWGEVADDTEKGEIKVKFGGASCYEQLSS